MSTLVRVALALAGLLAVGLGFWLRHMNARSAAWPAVRGRVVASRLGTDHDGDEAAHIKYRYQVGGQEHESDQVSYKVGSARSRTLAQISWLAIRWASRSTSTMTPLIPLGRFSSAARPRPGSRSPEWE